MNVLQKNPVFLSKFRRKHGLQFQQPCQRTFVKIQKKISQGQKKMKELQNSRKSRLFHKWSSQPIECCFESGGKFYNQKFDNFSLKSELEAERSPVKPLKRFLRTRRRQFWKPHWKTIDKSPTKKIVVIFPKLKGSLLTFSAHTLNAALTNFTEVCSAKVLKSIAERPKLTIK